MPHPKRVLQVAGQQRGPERIRLLTIGINEYKHINGLKEAVNDATKFRNLWENTIPGISRCYRLDEEDMPLHLTNSCATTDSILYGLDHVLGTDKKPVDEDDISIVYFSGHGTVIGGITTHETSHNPDKNSYKLLSGKPVTELEYTTISQEYIVEQMKSCRAQIGILILDCCYSGQALDSTMPLYSTGYRSKTLYLERIKNRDIDHSKVKVKVYDHENLKARAMDNPLDGFQGRARLLLTASKPTEPSYEIDGFGGLLTVALINALKGDGKTPIPILETIKNISNSMKKTIQETGFTQEPLINSSYNILDLGTLPPFQMQ